MTETIHYDPVTRQTYWPSRDTPPPHWANHLPEARTYWERKTWLQLLIGNPNPPFHDAPSHVTTPADRTTYRAPPSSTPSEPTT